MSLRFQKLDADEGAFFERQLESISERTYDVKYPALKARQYVPVDNSDDPGAMSTTYRQYDKKGEAKIVSGAARDIPRADINGHEFTRPVREVAMAYSWTIKEIRAAMMGRLNLNERRAMACREAIELKLDDIACFGDADHGIASGFLNEPNISVTNAAGAWATALTADQIIQDVSDMFSRIDDNSQQVEAPNMLLLPPVAYTHIATTPRATGSDLTILGFLQEAYRAFGLRIEPWYKLKTAGAGGATRAVMYNRSPETLVQRITAETDQLPPQEVGLEVLVHMLASTAGTEVHYPLACDFIDDL